MTDYSKMSDFEINRAVGEIALNGRWSCKPGTGGNDTESWYYGSVDTFVTPYAELSDYCNSWADAGPIAEKSHIGTMPSSGGTHMAWDISGGLLGDKQAHSEKLCRAICIVFLMMNEGE